METNERINLCRQAQELIEEAIECLEQAVQGSNSKGWAEAYIIARLKIVKDDDHGYATRDQNINDLISNLEDDEDE